jgi:hypothetical protein
MSILGVPSERVTNPTRFRAWMDDKIDCHIEVHVESYGRSVIFQAHLVDEEGNRLWHSCDKRTPEEARAYGDGMVRLYRYLAKRRRDQLVDPSSQIAYGIGERQSKRKATNA